MSKQESPDPNAEGIVSMPASLLQKFERVLGVDGAYRFFCTLNQEQVDLLIRVALKNEWVFFTGDEWHVEG